MREHHSPLHVLGLTATAIALTLGVCANAAPATTNAATTNSTRPGQPTSSASTRADRTPPPAAHARLGHSALAIGSGYNSPGGSELVRVLQRDLEAQGYPPGHIDGLYGPLTRHAVVGFQAAHGLPVDGVVGPRTWTALSEAAVILGPGAGDRAGGENAVRSLQRRLGSAGISPGPIDGRYGVLTDRAVSRFQRSHGLPATGIAGPRTLALLAKPKPSLRRSNPLRQKPAPSPTRTTRRPRPTGSTVAPAPRERPASNVPRESAHRPRSGSSPWMIILGTLALALALALGARSLIASRRHPRSRRERRPARPETAAGDAKSAPLEPTWLTTPGGDHEALATTNRTNTHTNGPRANASAAGIGNGANNRPPRGRADDLPEPAKTASAFNPGQQFAGQGGKVEAQAANGHADQRGHGIAASNLGRLLEEQGALAEAEAAYRRADELGDTAGAFHLGLLLEGQGGIVEAQAAYRRADQRGHGTAASNLGRLLEEQGALAEAQAAYRRADKRGDADGAFRLGVLLAEHGTLTEAEAAFRRADERGDPVAAFNLGVLLEEQGALAEAEAAYRRADQRGIPDGAFRLAVLLKQRGALDQATAAYDRASSRGHNAAALDLGVLLAEHGALADAETAFRRADERGDPAAAFNLAVLLHDRGALPEAEAAYHRARQRGDEEIANMAQAALLDFSQPADDISAQRAKRAQTA
jgi:peptidoglycan hydrolase-like protein with peptidoglycan-binding domain